MYKHSMKNEKPPKSKILHVPGWHQFIIKGVEEKVSKQNNAMFVFTVIHTESNQEEDVYCVAVEGKRWLLKQLLTACAVPAKGEVFEWSGKDVLGKKVLGFIQHEPNTYIDRTGKEVHTMQHKISNFQPIKTTKGWEEEDVSK